MDQTKRKLRVPASYLPYMEKFRIYELFHVSIYCIQVITRLLIVTIPSVLFSNLFTLTCAPPPLLQELGKELLLNKPDDHLEHLSQTLIHAAHTRNTKRIILIAPPFIDLTEISNAIAESFNLTVFTRANVNEIIKLVSSNMFNNN